MIISLKNKKQRDIQGLFILEGDKIISDLLISGELNLNNTVFICATSEWLGNWKQTFSNLLENAVIAEGDELKKLSSFQTPPLVMAVVKKPVYTFEPASLKEDISLAFDQVRDPGNLGTIIRTADWFGIRNIYCNIGSVDHYNNKAVQASMGSVMRVRVYYTDLQDLFSHAARLKVPVYGATMDGNDLFDTPVKAPGVILFGNESAGIDPAYDSFIKMKLRIPSYQAEMTSVESLNIASAVAVICSELRRRKR